MNEGLSKDVLAALAADLASVDEFSPRLKAFIYGPKGTGKTVTAAVTAAQLLNGTGKKTLFIDTSDGYRSIKNHPQILDTVVAMPFKSLGRINQVAKAIAAKQAPFDNVGAIVLDELSTMADRHLLRILEQRYPGVSPDDRPVPDWGDYRKLVAHVSGVMQFMYEDAGLHVFLVTHEKQEIKDNVVIKDAKPNLTPAVMSAIAGDVDIIARQTSVRKRVEGEWEYVRELQPWPTNKVEAKCRVGTMDFQVGILEFVENIIEWLNRGGVDVPVNTETVTGEEEGMED